MTFKRKLHIIWGFTLCFSFLSAQTSPNATVVSDSIITNTVFSPVAPAPKALTDSLVSFARLYLKTPYGYGSSGTSSFDCSGFSSFVYRNFGINLPRSSSEQAQKVPTVNVKELQPGDLVFFNGRRRGGSSVGHVGIVVSAKEDGEFDFIHAATSEGVTISNSKSIYYASRFVKAGRVFGVDLLNLPNVSTTVKRQEYVSANPSITSKKTIPAIYHKVKKGETLSSIADKYHLTVKELKQLNHLSKSQIQVKQNLLVKKEETVVEVLPIAEQVSINSKEIDQLTHIVKKGETLYSIAKKYNTTIDKLSQYNNIGKAELKVGMELKISEHKQNETLLGDNNTENIKTTHKVNKGETINLIAKKYNTSIERIKQLNNLKSTKINIGQELIVAESITLADNAKKTTVEKKKNESQLSVEPKVQTSNQQPIETKEALTVATTHIVKSGESMYSIARKYSVSIPQIQSLNNLGGTAVQLGQILNIPAPSMAQVKETKTQPNSSTTEKVSKIIEHTVQKGDNLLTISKKYGCKISDLRIWNNKTDDKLQVGEKLIINQNI